MPNTLNCPVKAEISVDKNILSAFDFLDKINTDRKRNGEKLLIAVVLTRDFSRWSPAPISRPITPEVTSQRDNDT